jgi:3-methyladenine DNA glycosylase AlkD
MIEREASDGRDMVKKGINWALRQIGKRNLALHAEALLVARRLAASAQSSARWIGGDAVRELQSEAVVASLQRRSA